MRATKKWAIVLGAALGMSCSVALIALRVRSDRQAALAQLANARIVLEQGIRKQEMRNATLERQRLDLSRQLEELKSRPTSAASGVDKRSNPPEEPRTMSDIVAGDPDAQLKMLQWQRGMVAIAYRPFFRAHNISSETIQRLEDNTVARQEDYIDLRAARKSQDAAGRETIAALEKKSESGYEAAQAEILGPDLYARLQEFDRTVVVRNVVVLGLAGAAALANVPLTTEQGDQLWAAALDATGRDSKTSGEALVRKIDWDVLDARARQILSPEQFTLYRNGSAPSGFQSRWKYQLDAAFARAREADAATPRAPGG